MFGKKHTEKTKRKMRSRQVSCETKEKIRLRNKNKIVSAETKLKMSLAAFNRYNNGKRKSNSQCSKAN